MICRAHLYRHHRIFPCQRCKTLFKSQDEVNEHQKEPEPCLLRETELGDGLTSDIVEKLKSRKKSDKNQTESERWREIYKLLFPQDLVPDPCKSSSASLLNFILCTCLTRSNRLRSRTRESLSITRFQGAREL